MVKTVGGLLIAFTVLAVVIAAWSTSMLDRWPRAGPTLIMASVATITAVECALLLMWLL